MSDLEQQLSATLTGVAEGAPSTSGLAEAARRRHRVRRQRRLAAGGVLAAIAVIAAGIAVAQNGGDDHVAKDPTDGRSSWQTISSGDARASVPPDWTAHECEPEAPVVHGPTVDEACVDGVGAVIAPQTSRERRAYGEIVSGDGGWLGYVSVGEEDLRVFHEDRALVRRVLASGRLDGQPVVDVEEWVRFERDGLTYEVPAWWGVGEDGDRSDYSVCLTELENAGASSQEQRDPATFVFGESPGPEGTVVVTAPTQAVAELVMATVEVGPDAAPGTCEPEDFALGLLPPEGGSPDPVEEVELSYERVEVEGIGVEVPATWTVKDDCGGIVSITPGVGCESPLSSGTVRFYPEELFDPVMSEGELVGGTDGDPWAGVVRRGEYVVYVAHADRQIVVEILSSIQ